MMKLAPPHAAGGRLLKELDAECALAQPPRHGTANWLAIIKVAEWEEIHDRLGPQGCSEILHELAALVSDAIPGGDRVLQGRDGEISLVVHERSEAQLGRLFASLSRRIVGHRFHPGDEPIRVTPAIGFTAFVETVDARRTLRCARAAVQHSLSNLDLRPTALSNLLNEPSAWQEWLLRMRRSIRFAVQVVAALFIVLGLPLLVYLSLPTAAAMQLTGWVFVTTLAVLVVTATLINIEGLLSLRPQRPPERPGEPYPPATAIIVAYLPNEAASVVATVESLLAVDYPAPLQVILAYNTPHDLPVEAQLHDRARRDPRFVALRVHNSTSKAQNINAALAVADGEFTGIFDADHRPQPDSFMRAWHWLSDGADVVQGHCVVRNGGATLLSRLIAVEFEQIYATAHPGGARLRGFGIFGGSNGYWRTSVLREVRMRSSMLTEDIDSSMRAVFEGKRIMSDPGLISTELAPVTLRSLTHQRLRWAQGWFQVSLRHTRLLLASPHLGLRQKIAVLYLLPWRELFPWLSLQILPVLAYWLLAANSIHELDWRIPLLLVTTFYVLSTGPLQTVIAYANAAPLVKRHRRWFLMHFFLVTLYSEFLTLLARVAHLRQLFGDVEWRITARPLKGVAAAPRSERGGDTGLAGSLARVGYGPGCQRVVQVFTRTGLQRLLRSYGWGWPGVRNG